MTSTEARNHLLIGLEPEHVGTYHEYVRARAGEKMSEAEAVEFGRDVYHKVVQMVLDNEFSPGSKRTFPAILFNFSLLSLQAWVERMQVLFSLLPRSEQKLFRTLEIVWMERELTRP